MTCRAPPQQGQLLASTSIRVSIRGRCAGKAPRLRRRTRGARRGPVLCSQLLLGRLGGRRGLPEVLQAELQLVGVEPLRAPPEPPTLQLPDQEPQLLDLGLRRVTLLANEVALGANCIPLGHDSIALDLESGVSRALGGSDFSHLS